MKSLKFLSVLLGGLIMSSSVFGQYFEYEVNGWINPFLPGLDNKLYAEIDVTWSDTDLSGKIDTATVTVTNFDTSNDDWTMSSELTGFFILKPLVGTQYQDAIIEDPMDASNPANWTITNELVDSLKGYGGLDISELDNYFGAVSPGGDGLVSSVSGTVGTFTFHFNDFILDPEYDIDGDPTVMVRWQSVMYVDDTYNFLQYNESGKGGVGGPGWEPVIPEPSEVAFLGIFGLGALLYGRRRFMKKAR